MQKFVWLVFGVLALTACSKSKVSDEQKDKIKGLAADINTVESSAGAGVSDISNARRGIVDEARKLRLASKLSGCTKTTPQSGSSEFSGGLMSQNVEVSGTSCPIHLSAHMAINEGTNQELSMSYSSTDEDFISISRLREMTVTGHANFSGTQADMLVDAKINSTTYGQVEVYMKAEIDMSTKAADIVLRFTFPDFTVEVKALARNGGATMTINGEDADKDEVEELINLIK